MVQLRPTLIPAPVRTSQLRPTRPSTGPHDRHTFRTDSRCYHYYRGAIQALQRPERLYHQLYRIVCRLHCSYHLLLWREIPQGRYVPSGGTNISESSNAICHPSSNGTADEQQCDTNGGYSQLENYLYVFVLATFLMSFLVGPLYTLGVAYLDENVSKKVSGGYVGILYASTAIGPAVGYVMSSQLLNQYVNWPEVTNLTPNDQQWLGNWWFGFFPLAIVAFLVAIPVFCFPRKLAGISKRPEETKEEANIPTSKDDKDGALEEDDDDEPTNPFSCGSQDFKDFWSTGKDLGSNFSYMSVCLAGLLLIPAGAVGNLFGGWLAKKAGADCKKLIKLILIVSAASLLGHCVFLLYCTTPGSTTYLATNR
uniref:Major facilitator superfamily (MFS) profile domain-containing protein n=1 Tax=Branchiostoma floridae TaxID=7739 RepID=C3Y4U6_BRAFL|eukprot:XP_002608743.1 hypothetical protein BRAFLDRAFT_73964 [Branchiostoma floridae]